MLLISLTNISYTAWLLVPRFRPDVLQVEAVGDAAKMEFNQSLRNGDADCLFNPIREKKNQDHGNLH